MSRHTMPMTGGMLAVVAGILLVGSPRAVPDADDESVSLDAAILFFEQRVTDRPTDYIAAGELASRYIARFGRAGDIDDITAADTVLHAALDVFPGHGPNHALMVKVHIARHEFPEALAAARRAWNLNPRQATNGVLFDAHYEMAQYDSALAALAQLDHRSFAYLTRAARWSEHVDAPADALRFMRRACRPDDVHSDRLRAWCLVRIGEVEASLGMAGSRDRFQDALDIVPGHAAANLRLGDLALSNRQAGQARRYFETASAADVGVEAFLRLADLAEAGGDAPTATRYRRLFLARAMQPKFGRAFWLPAAEALTRLGQTDSALALVRADVDQRPGPESYAGLESLAIAMGNQQLRSLAADSLAWYSTVRSRP